MTFQKAHLAVKFSSRPPSLMRALRATPPRRAVNAPSPFGARTCESSVTASAAANTTRCREESVENANGSLAGCCVRTLRETRGEALAGFGAAGRSALLEAASLEGQRAGGDACLGGSICAGRMCLGLL